MPTETKTETAVGYIRLSQDGKSLARWSRMNFSTNLWRFEDECADPCEHR
ncbi:MAG TPA: hypothetical protein VFJ06_02330 [Halococcus sp.]|nr:hypothetical protein [Halococcus sp.]